MPHPGQHHGHAVLVGGGDHLAVAHRTPRLDDGGDPVFGGQIDAVAEREEGIGTHCRAFQIQLFLLRLHGGDARREHPAHLPGADPENHAVPAVDDGVGFDELHHLPGEQQIG